MAQGELLRMDTHSDGSAVEFVGQLQPGVVGKDVIITLCGLYKKDQVSVLREQNHSCSGRS